MLSTKDHNKDEALFGDGKENNLLTIQNVNLWKLN